MRRFRVLLPRLPQFPFALALFVRGHLQFLDGDRAQTPHSVNQLQRQFVTLRFAELAQVILQVLVSADESDRLLDVRVRTNVTRRLSDLLFGLI